MTGEQLTQRKDMLLKLFEDPAYVPMKIKEIAILLDVPKGGFKGSAGCPCFRR